ncbi:MAG TPA: hypothetical protein VHJ55_09975 [Casimicrobiaceae bacterium]|nr:hypothetical protein [Casimicrobiaceae bacterium]
MAEAVLPANSVGIWAFGPSVTRFVPAGYHPEAAHESMVEKTKRVAGGLADVLDGLEYHYPFEVNEVNEVNVAQISDVLETHGMALPVVASGLQPDPTYALGSLINPDTGLRRRAIETNLRGVELAASIGASFIVWPGSEGYNYLFQRRYADT